MCKQFVLPVIAVLASFSLSAQNYITLYEQCNYSGRSYTLTPGNYRGYQMKIDNDRLASILIPAGMKVTIYEHDEFNGRSAIYTSGTSCLPFDWRNTVSSIIVEETYGQGGYGQNDYVIFYNDCSFRGYSQTLRPGSYPGSELGLLKNNLSSFSIRGNLRVRLFFNNEYFSGSSESYDLSQTCLPGMQNDKTGSLIIEYKPSVPSYPGGGTNSNQYATVFADCNYNGNALRLMPGYYQGDKLGLMKYNISSIEVPVGLRVKVFINNEYLSGQSYTINTSINCMNSTMQNRIGSLLIEESGGYTNYPPIGNAADRVVIYDLEEFQGRSAALLPGTYRNMQEAGFIDNALSSLTVPAGYRVILYEYVNFGGKSYTITNTKNKFYISGWSNRTSSIAVYRDR